MSLASMGLTAAQERLYRYLLRTAHADLDTAAAELREPGVREVAAELQALGLVDLSLTAVAPATAVDLLVRRRIEQTQRQLGELTLAWDMVTELAEEHRSRRPVQMIEHLPDGAAVTRRMGALMADHPGEFMHMKGKALVRRKPYDAGRFKAALARGLRSRTLFAAQALADPAQEPYARSFHALGDLHRVTTEPIRHLAIVNRSVAFMKTSLMLGTAAAALLVGGAAACSGGAGQGAAVTTGTAQPAATGTAQPASSNGPLDPAAQRYLDAVTAKDAGAVAAAFAPDGLFDITDGLITKATLECA
ncbi:hypothetical protein [Nonomuraea sp. NPDC050643]|uniref:hypothetical protein n=1 Tax=Nonomuraea sp. NPDC050643 TaxID=3155660 RepID=UPI0033E9EB88